MALLALRDHVALLNGMFSSETVWPIASLNYKITVVQEMTGIYTPNLSTRTEITFEEIMPAGWEEPSNDSDDEAVQALIKTVRARSKGIIEQWLATASLVSSYQHLADAA